MSRHKDIRTSESVEFRYIEKITKHSASQSQGGIYGLSQKSINFLHDGKYSSKGGEFLGFYLYFCHVIQSFICF